MAQPQGISIAFGQNSLDATPTWTRIDDGVTRVASYTIDRGRQFELDQTDGGRAEIRINDVDGTLDPTNSGGPYYGEIDSLLQIAIARWNPITADWHTRFRGFVGEYDYVFNPAAYVNEDGDVVGVNQLTMSLVDIFEILQAAEMYPGQFGDTPPAGASGQIFFDNANVDDRIIQILGNAGIDPAFYVVFSGNVSIHEATYSPGETALTAIQEAVDAEFPGVSNFYTDRFGRCVFHGRLAKFDPVGTAASTTPDRWDYQAWKAGDGAAVALSASDTAHIRRFAFNRGVGKIFNQALAAPIGIADANIAGQLVQDLTSIGINGYRTWPAKLNLLTESGLLDSSTDLVETKRFATYIVDNYAEARNRVTDIAFKAKHPDATGAAANWLQLCKSDIADAMEVTIGSPGGGGFNLEPFFIEGIHEEVTGKIYGGVDPGAEPYDAVTISYDLSNQALFTTNPFPLS